MNIKKNKRGMALPMVLGIIVFVFGLTATLMTYITFQSRFVNIDLDQSEAYQNSVSDVSAALHIISREQNLDPLFLEGIENYFNVNIELNDNSVYTITSVFNQDDQVISYLSGTAQDTSIENVLFQYTGVEETFTLSPLITPTTLLSAFLPQYINNSFDWIESETQFSSFIDIMQYVRSLAIEGSSYQYKLPSDLESQLQPTVSSYWYIDGNVDIAAGNRKSNNVIRNLVVESDKVLFINGDLTMNAGSTIYGNVVINGNLTISGKGNSLEGIKGTLYVNGNITTSNNMSLGTIDRPSFIFSEGDIYLGNKVDGYGYFLGNIIDGNPGNTTIVGGVYPTNQTNLKDTNITANTSLDEQLLYDYAIPSTVAVDSDPSNGTGESSFKYTYPK